MPVNPIGRLRVLTAGSMSANAMLRVGEGYRALGVASCILVAADTMGPLIAISKRSLTPLTVFWLLY